MFLRKILCSHLLLRGDRQELGNVLFFLTGTLVIRWPCSCTKQKQSVAREIPKILFHHCSVHQHGCHDVRYKPR